MKKKKRTKKNEKLTSQKLRELCEKNGFRFVVDVGPAPVPTDKGLYQGSTVFIPEGSKKAVKLGD